MSISRCRNALATVALAATLLPSPGGAQSVTTELGGPNFSCWWAFAGFCIPVTSSTGDYWRQTDIGGSLTLVDHLALTLHLADAFTHPPQVLNVALNGNSVGGFSVPSHF